MTKMNMTELEKGYHCPDYQDCRQCPLMKTDCIVYSKKGQEKLKQFKKEHKQK